MVNARSHEPTGRFDGRVVIATGAGGAIGRATAIRFAAEGARVAVFDIAADLDERGWSWRDVEDAANELIGRGAVEVEMPSHRWAVTEVGLALLDRAGADR